MRREAATLSLGLRRGDHAGRDVDAGDVDARSRDSKAHAPGAAAKLQHGSAAGARLLHVKVDVMRQIGVHRVVDVSPVVVREIEWH